MQILAFHDLKSKCWISVKMMKISATNIWYWGIADISLSSIKSKTLSKVSVWTNQRPVQIIQSFWLVQIEKLKNNIFIRSSNLPENEWVRAGQKFFASLVYILQRAMIKLENKTKHLTLDFIHNHLSFWNLFVLKSFFCIFLRKAILSSWSWSISYL